MDNLIVAQNNTTNKTSHLYLEPLATQLEDQRSKARSKHRITYDCFNATTDDGYVLCTEHNYPLRGRRGLLTLPDCLRGLCANLCTRCQHYEDGEVEGG